MTPAFITRIQTILTTGQPSGYAGSDIAREDWNALTGMIERIADAKPSAQPAAAKPAVTDLPESIWLVLGDPPPPPGTLRSELAEITWSDEKVFSGDVRYVRADLPAAATVPGDHIALVSSFDGLIDDYQQASKDGTTNDRAQARKALRDAYHAALEAPAAQAVPDSWLDIATAPKTGRTLLLGYLNSLGKWRTTRGEWMSEEYIAEYFDDPDDVEPGWFETSVEADDLPNCWRIEPTHWMPLPAAPAALTTQGASHGD